MVYDQSSQADQDCFGTATYGALSLVQNKYFQNSHVLGEATVSVPQDQDSEHVDSVDFKTVVGLAAFGVKASPYVEFVNDLMGDKDSVKTYLLVFQNNSEIRPTGGFMGSYAWIRIVGGTQVSFGIPGGGFYDLSGARNVLVKAPKPFQIFSPTEQIWNANWYRDFPASAKRIEWFYVNSGEDSVDGVIAVTPELLRQLLQVSGPIELPEFKKTISAENAYQELQYHVEFEYDKQKNQPKEIIALLTQKLFERLTNISSSEYPRVLDIVSELLAKQHVIAFVNDEHAQAFLQERDWDGRMLEYRQHEREEGGLGDYVSIVHTNIGGGKTDYVVTTHESIEKTFLDDGTLRTEVTIIREHHGDAADPLTGLTNIDYVRVYAPLGAQYVGSDGFGGLPEDLYKRFEGESGRVDIPEQIERDAVVIESNETRVVTETYPALGKVPERSYTSFGNWMIVKPGETVISKLTFDVPGVVEERESSLRKLFARLLLKNKQSLYSLVWQKQPGLDSVEQALRLNIPGGYESYVSQITPSSTDDHRITWKSDSGQNHLFVVGLK